ncbi:AMP-binding enzyme [Curtobacterium sp. VKM Ac-1376]|uniref:AMP-binding enzyme n=1 Tax=Curtobacterium sp. VKM Ac-1376 TaxID=123312 RepID=UPI001E5BD549|nr:hypothetical protein [Curtobacterium sp. VKM Ac-1376]
MTETRSDHDATRFREVFEGSFTYVNGFVRNTGWFHPGDLATWDEHERVTIVGRRDDMIISGGENVHPVQVEAVLQEHPGVADSIVVGVPDPRWGRSSRRSSSARPAGCRRRRRGRRGPGGVDRLAPRARPVQAAAVVPVRRRGPLQRHGQEGALPGEGVCSVRPGGWPPDRAVGAPAG